MTFYEIWDHFPIMFAGILIIFVLILLFMLTKWFLVAPKNLPPGPNGLPIVGYLPFMGPIVHETFNELSGKYGNIFHLYFGNCLVVVLNDYAAIKEALLKQAEIFKGRPPDANFAESKNENLGLAISDGEHWRQHRRFILTNLRDNGVGKLTLEPLILNEISYFLTELRKHCGTAFQIRGLLNSSLVNNVNILVSGQRYEYHEPITKTILKLFNDFHELTNTLALQTFFPWIIYVPGIDFFLRRKIRRKVMQDFLDIVGKIIQKATKSNSGNGGDTYVEAFLKEKNTRLQTNKNEEIFTDLSLLHNCRDLMAAGADTSASTLLWALLYMTKYPEIQKKVQNELDEAIGHEREPSFNDRTKTPYTEATLYEIQRVASLAPLNPRRNIKATTLFGYNIPIDTMILSNLYAVHHDPKLWGDPENFRPERFISPSGEAVKPEYLIPFGIGKRACVGEPLARMELYLYFTSLLLNFDFVPVNGADTSVVAKRGMFRLPKYQIVCPQKRSF